MELLFVFVVGFEIGVLTGLPVILWRRDARRRGSKSRAADVMRETKIGNPVR
jgi:hypothetical protein